MNYELCIMNYPHLERETGLEPATSSLGSLHSTTELLSHIAVSHHKIDKKSKKIDFTMTLLRKYELINTIGGVVMNYALCIMN